MNVPSLINQILLDYYHFFLKKLQTLHEHTYNYIFGFIFNYTPRICFWKPVG